MMQALTHPATDGPVKSSVRHIDTDNLPASTLADNARFELQPLEPRVMLSVTINAAGWTEIAPAADTRIIYVSASAGSDSNSGLSENAPVKTLEHAKSLLRDGRGDWMLLKRGDVWYESLGDWKISGRNADAPAVISSYGSGNRPVLRTGTTSGILATANNNVSHVAIIGLHFHAHERDGSHGTVKTSGMPGVRWFASGSNLLMEDMVIQSYVTNVVVQSRDGFSDFKLRRSAILDAYATSGHSQGMYVENIHGITLEENFFDHNGWHPTIRGAEATIFNHNIYIQANSSGLVVRNNIIARASSHGLQARPGGIVAGNLFVENPMGLSFGLVLGGAVTKGLVSDAGVSGQVINNVFLNGTDIQSHLPRGIGMEIANLNGALIAGNLLMHHNSNPINTTAISVNGSLNGGMRNTLIENNTIVDWDGGMRVNGSPGNFVDVAFRNNTIIDNGGRLPLMRFDEVIPQARFAIHDNNYHSHQNDNRWFRVGTGTLPFNEWSGKVNERGSQTAPIPMHDPQRDLATYHQALGGSGSNGAFYNGARGNLVTFDTRYSAAAINQFLRAGYGLATEGASPQPPVGSTPMPPVGSTPLPPQHYQPVTDGKFPSAVIASFSDNGSGQRIAHVLFHGENSVDLSSITGNELLVSGPNGLAVPIELIGVQSQEHGRVLATYRLNIPPQGWSLGQYTIALRDASVEDVLGNYNHPGSLGTFHINQLTPHYDKRHARNLGELLDHHHVTGTILGSGDVFHEVHASRNTVMTITLAGAGPNAIVSILSPNGALLATSQPDGHGNQVVQVTVQKGRPLIRVTTQGPANFALNIQTNLAPSANSDLQAAQAQAAANQAQRVRLLNSSRLTVQDQAVRGSAFQIFGR